MRPARDINPLLNYLVDHDAITVDEAADLYGEPRHLMAVWLPRVAARGLITRIAPSTYALAGDLVGIPELVCGAQPIRQIVGESKALARRLLLTHHQCGETAIAELLAGLYRQLTRDLVILEAALKAAGAVETKEAVS